MNSPVIKNNQPNEFTKLEIAQSRTHRISTNDLIAFGEEKSGTFIKIIKEVFGGMKWVNDALNERFYNRAVDVINKHNWEIVKNEFKIQGQDKNVSLAKLVPKDAILLPDTAQYKMIKKYHDDETLKTEIKGMKNEIQGNKWFERTEKQEHWLDHFTYDLEKELDGLLEGDSSNIHRLNELEKEYHDDIPQSDFGELAHAVIGNNIKKVSDAQIRDIEDVLKFSKENHLKPLDVYKQLENHLEHYDKTDDKEAFLEFFKDQKVVSTTIPDAIKEVTRSFNFTELNKLNRKFGSVGSPESLKNRISENEGVRSGAIYYKDSAKLNIKPEELQHKIDRLENIKDLVEPFGLSDDFEGYIRAEFDNNISPNASLKQVFDKVATKMETFFVVFQDVEEIQPSDIKDLYTLYTDRINKTEKSPLEVANEIKAQIKENGLKSTLESLRLKKDITDVEILNALDVASDKISDAVTTASNQVATAFSRWTDSFKTPPTQSELQINAQKNDFKNWLKDKKLPHDDAARLYEFYDRVVDKKVYSPEIIAKALKNELETKELDSYMDSLFPRTSFDWFGAKKHIEADPLDLFFESDGKEALLETCFKLQIKDTIEQMCGKEKVPFDKETLATGLNNLFTNRNALITEGSLDGANVFVSYATTLALQGYPVPIILKELEAKKANFSDYNLKEMSAKLDPQVLQRIEVNIQKDIERSEIKTGVKKDNVIDLFRRDPTALIANVGSTFIETLFPDSPSINKEKIQKELNNFAPLLNPLMENFSSKDEDIINGALGGLLRTSPKTLSLALTGVVQEVANDQIQFDKSKNDMYQTVVQTILDANEKYRRAKENKTELKKSELTPVEEWLLFDLNGLNKGASFIPALVGMQTGAITGYFVGRAVKGLVASFVENNPNLDTREKEKMADSASALVKMLLPVIPKIKEKHNLELYRAFINDLNNLVRSDKEITGEEVTVKIKGIVDHFIQNELDQEYNAPIHASLQAINTALQNG